MLVNSYTKRIDYYAYPRVGSHYLFHILSGLYDLVLLDSENFHTEEYLSRSNELDEMSLYSLRLRDSSLPGSAPIYLNPNPNGIHGMAKDFGYPIICLTREPVAAIYSYYRMKRDRFHEKIDDLTLWIGERLQEYTDFYKEALVEGEKKPEHFLLLRYEDVCSSPEYLQRICDFIGESPKLDPAFVHHMTSFSNFIKEGDRTFYREGDNAKWRKDHDFVTSLGQSDYPSLSGLGYPSPTI